MKTALAVEDGKLPNELLGGFYRRTGEILRRINEGTLDYQWVMNQLQKIVEGRNIEEFPQWDISKTIKLGTGPKTADDFHNALKERDSMSHWVGNILSTPAFTVATEETEVDLVFISEGELGFKNGAKRSYIYKRAIERGLQLCPAEVGPQLLLQCGNQLKGFFLIGMEPITDSEGPVVFCLEGGGDNGRHRLEGVYGGSDMISNAEDIWVFVCPRK